MTEPIELITPSSPTAFSADAFGDWLAVSWASDIDPGPGQEVSVTLVERSGVGVVSATIGTLSPVVGAPSVLGAGEDDGMLLAWSESPVDGSGDRIQVARIDCEDWD